MWLTVWEPDHLENPVELVLMVRIRCLNVFLTAVKYRLIGQQFSKNTPNRPDIKIRQMKRRLQHGSTTHTQTTSSYRSPWCNAGRPVATLAPDTKTSRPPGPSRPKVSAASWTNERIPCRRFSRVHVRSHRPSPRYSPVSVRTNKSSRSKRSAKLGKSRNGAYQVPVQHPVRVEVMNALK